MIAEGAGGLLVPIAPGLDMADLAARLDLTLEAAAARGLRVLGVAISHTTAVHPPADQWNLELLLARLPAPFLGELRHGATRLAGLDLAALLASAGSA